MIKYFSTATVLFVVAGLQFTPAQSLSFPANPVPIDKYKDVISSVKGAWLSLDQVAQPESEKSPTRAKLKQALIALYEAEHKQATAGWISSLEDSILSKEIAKQKAENAPDFIPEQPYSCFFARIADDGSFFIRAACVSTNISVPPDSPNYKAIRQAIGPIEPGYTKEISPLPDGLWKAEEDRMWGRRPTIR